MRTSYFALPQRMKDLEAIPVTEELTTLKEFLASVGLSGGCSFDRYVQRLRGRKGKVEFLKPYNMSVDILY